MAKNSFDGAYALLEATKFGGIDTTAVFGEGGECSEMRNFRVLSDGSLEKRCGYGLAVEMDGEIRALWSGTIDDIDTVMVVVGREVFNILSDGGEKVKIGEIIGESGDISFFRMDGGLYIIDGFGIYICTRSSVSPIGEGYVPLYGLGWGKNGGVINEPLNQLSRRIRLNYVIDGDSTLNLEIGLKLVSIGRVVVNGVDMTSKVSIDKTSLRFAGQFVSDGDVIDAVVTVDDSCFEKSELFSCRHAVVYGGRYDNGVYCFGGNDGSRVFRSRYVGANALKDAQAVADGCSGLYFPAGYDFKVDDGHTEVKAICRHYDRLLLFGYNDTRVNDLSDAAQRDIPVMPVNSGVGCRGPRGVALCENDPVTVSRDGIYRWSSNTDERDESNAELISAPVAAFIDEGFLGRAVVFNCRGKREMWFGDPDDADGLVLVYNYALGVWYCFDGIFADEFFSFGSKVGFYSGTSVYLFDDDEYSDCGREIVGEFVSRYSDMGRSAGIKRMQRCLAVGSGVGNYTVEFCNDEGRIVTSVDFVGRAGRGADCQERILRTGRFSYIKYRIIAPGKVRQRIYGITLIAGK